MEKIKIDGEFIKLDSLLKFAGLVETGGHAKIEILGGSVLVNNEICFQRGRKIKSGDKVSFNGQEIVVE